MATSTRQWLKEELENQILPEIAKLNFDRRGKLRAKKLCTSMRDAWAARGLTSARQQQGCMDQVRAAIRESLGKQHWSLDYIKLLTEEHVEINHAKSLKTRERQLQQLYLKDPDAIVATAVRLLSSNDWAEVTAGLAVLTGRRLNELLETAEFAEVSQWVVRFEGALKRRDEAVPLVFDIPTLTTARRVIQAVDHLRSIAPEGEVNESSEVAHASTKHFEKLVPAPPGKTGLYAHLWRSVYATIATFWYCPRQVDEMLFKAHILGHFETLSEEEQSNVGRLQKRLESFASDRHYRMYEIDDEVIAHYRGKRRGIKLGEGGITVLPVFAKENQPISLPKRTLSTLKVFADDKVLLEAIYDRLDLSPNLSQHERFSGLLAWAINMLEQPLKQGQEEEQEQVQEQGQEQELQEVPLAEVDDRATSLPEAIAGLVEVPQDPLRQDLQALVATLQQFVALQMNAAPLTNPSLAHRSSQNAAKMDEGMAEDQESLNQPRKPRSSPQENDRLINTAINEIIAYNNAPERSHKEKWEISVNVLKAWGFPQTAIYRIRNQRLDEINLHHAAHAIQPKHNLSHHRGQNPKVAIASLN